MSATMDSDLKQIVLIGTVVLGIFVAGYMIQVERRAAVADRKFTDWIHENQLNQYVELFFKEDISYLDGLVHFDLEEANSFKSLSKERKAEVSQALDRLKQETVLRTWLHTRGLSENYVDRLKSIGVENLWQLSSLSERRLQSLTEHDQTFGDYRYFMRGISQLKSSRLRDVEKEMLSHHKTGFVPPGSYSLLTFLLMILTTLALIGVSFSIMLISRAQNVGSMFNLSSISKKSLYFLTGQYDVAQHTKVTWNWDEPQSVGKMMTFSIRFFHKNGKPYPVSNKDNITVEISHGGSEVTKAMTLGGVNPEEVNLAQVSFTVHKSGDYTVCIMFSSRHIKGSPFTKKFEAVCSSCNPGLTRETISGLSPSVTNGAECNKI